jgi:hypothetical protein
MRRIILVSAFSVAFMATQANAQGLTVYAGYLNPGSLNLTNIRNDLAVRGTGIYGARLEFDFHHVIGIEEDISFSPRLFDSSLIPNSNEVRGLLYSSNLVVNLPLSHFVPYVTGGVGFMKPWGSGFKPFDTKFAGNYGGGVKLEKLIGPVGLRFDVRGYTIPDVNHQNLNILEASGGILFSFH